MPKLTNEHQKTIESIPNVVRVESDEKYVYITFEPHTNPGDIFGALPKEIEEKYTPVFLDIEGDVW